jgi:ubiquinone/menaquinone biosynthesis C-methylase UbiE
MLYKDKKTYPRVFGLGDERPSFWTRFRLAFQKFNTKIWYQLVSLKAPGDLTFMNFGYAAPDSGGHTLELEGAEEGNRYPTQLYNRVASAVNLRGKDVLEVGSGRGGGSAFVEKHLGPRSMTGMDFCGKAVAFCQKRHGNETLSFRRGDAENLPFPAESFDAVVNVESCHCYVSVDRFLGQVAQVLRPGGHLLFADVGPKPYVDALREQLSRSGLLMIEEEDITPNVIRALEFTSNRNRASIQKEVPPGFRTMFRNFAGIHGTPVFDAFCTKEWMYMRYVLQKP